MMIGEEILAHDVDPDLQDVFSERPGVADSTHYRHIPARKGSGFIDLAGRQMTEFGNRRVEVHYRRFVATIVFYDRLNLSLIEWPVRPSNDYCIRSLDPVQRFAQAPEGRHLKTAKGVGRINQQDVEVARQGKVLISVIKHQDIRSDLRFDPLCTFVSVLFRDDRDVRQPS